MKSITTSGRARFTAVAVAVAAFACLGGVGYAAGLVHFTHASPTSAQYPPAKVTICHHTHSQHNPFVTITVSERALPAHLRHGDTVGACSEQQGSTQTEKQKGGPKKERPAHQNHGRHNGENKAAKAEKQSPARGAVVHGNQGKGLDHGSGTVHGKAHAQGKGNGKGQGHGKGNGNGNGQGHGQGHDPGGDHGNSGGGKGRKP